MEDLTIIDGIVALIIVLSALLAYSRGFVREVLAIGGWIVAAILAFIFAPQVEPLVKEVPVVGEFLAETCALSMLAAAAAIFAVVLIVASFITPLFSSAVQRSALGGLDQGAGFLFGVARGVLLVAIAYFVYETVGASQEFEIIDDSRSARVFAQMTGSVESGEPQKALTWVTEKFEELVGACDAPQ
ncbi:MAG: CvpA family protein [Pseudomonadota bacterium]